MSIIDVFALALVAGFALGYWFGIRRFRNDSPPDDVAPHRHLSSRGRAADGSDEFPADGDSANLAARIQATRRNGA